MSLRQRQSLLTPQEYLALAREAATKSEYYAGEVFALAGAGPRHVRIMVNCVASLSVQLKGRSCEQWNFNAGTRGRKGFARGKSYVR